MTCFFSLYAFSILAYPLLDITGMSQGQIAATFQYNYPVLTDDFLFRLDPDGFEAMRTAYQYRREFSII